MSKKIMKTVGITGVMGAGKSSAIQILKEAGYHVIDCDQINSDLLQKDRLGYLSLVDYFHQNILDCDGNIDRKKMSDVIFNNEENKKVAEAILHPLIKAEIYRQLSCLSDEWIVFVEVPLLFEVGWQDAFDEVWVVVADESLILSRLVQFRNVSKQEALRRLAKQMPQKVKIEQADVVLWNNLDKTALKNNIYDILKEKKVEVSNA